MEKEDNLMEKIVSLCKRRGFIFQSSEIYGGAAAAYDYGPLGVELKNNLKRLWWEEMVKTRENVVGLDAAIFMHPRVWQASGHLAEFTDLLQECKKCHHRFREKDLPDSKCPMCGGELTKPRAFNLMFETYLGPVKDEASRIFLRPETAQGIYVDYKSVQNAMRLKPPFGIAQIGKAFRNEITPGNFTFRTVEFEQMEMQFFIDPKEDKKWFNYWRKERLKWYLENLGLKKENIRFYKHKRKELAHYAKEAVDIEYKMPFGWQEIEGIHNRTDFDLKAHEKLSGKDLKYYNKEAEKKFIPYIIETSGGVDRAALAIFLDAYTEEEVRGKKRVVMKFKPQLAPFKVAVLPLLSNRKKLTEKAREIYEDLKNCYHSWYDEAGSIGRRYRRQDEVGTPYAITIDFDTLKDDTVTVRDRDTMVQERVKIGELRDYLFKKLM